MPPGLELVEQGMHRSGRVQWTQAGDFLAVLDQSPGPVARLRQRMGALEAGGNNKLAPTACFLRRQALRPVACTAPEQQFGVPFLIEGGRLRRRFRRTGAACPVQARPFCRTGKPPLYSDSSTSSGSVAPLRGSSRATSFAQAGSGQQLPAMAFAAFGSSRCGPDRSRQGPTGVPASGSG